MGGEFEGGNAYVLWSSVSLVLRNPVHYFWLSIAVGRMLLVALYSLSWLDVYYRFGIPGCLCLVSFPGVVRQLRSFAILSNYFWLSSSLGRVRVVRRLFVCRMVKATCTVGGD